MMPQHLVTFTCSLRKWWDTLNNIGPDYAKCIQNVACGEKWILK